MRLCGSVLALTSFPPHVSGEDNEDRRSCGQTFCDVPNRFWGSQSQRLRRWRAQAELFAQKAGRVRTVAAALLALGVLAAMNVIAGLIFRITP